MAHVCPIHPFLPVLQHRRCIMYNRHEGVVYCFKLPLAAPFLQKPYILWFSTRFESKYRNQDYRVQNASVSLLLSVLCFIVYGKIIHVSSTVQILIKDCDLT